MPKPKKPGKPPLVAGGKPPLKPLFGVAKRYLPPWESGIPEPVIDPAQDAYEGPDWSGVTAKIQLVRRLFISEYVKDFNGTRAVLRMGYPTNVPAHIASMWLDEAFTVWLLDEYLKTAEQDALISRGGIIAGLIRESNSRGLDATGASRVSALGKLAKIYGMEVVKVEVSKIGPGVMLVPMGGTPEDWEKNAAEAQRELQKQAKSA